MSWEKNKKDILDSEHLSNSMNEFWENEYRWYYDYYDGDAYNICYNTQLGDVDIEYGYKGETKDCRIVDLDNLTKERKRNVLIDQIFNQDINKNTIGNIINEKL